jgi:glutamine amidotransferase PdxT
MTTASSVIGILALQGAVEEHAISVSKLGCVAKLVRSYTSYYDSMLKLNAG